MSTISLPSRIKKRRVDNDEYSTNPNTTKERNRQAKISTNDLVKKKYKDAKKAIGEAKRRRKKKVEGSNKYNAAGSTT